MFTGMMLFFVLILFFAFFAVYKRDRLVRLFSLNTAADAGEFQQALEQTADAAVRRLETQIAHLEMLLDEADAKIAMLDERLQAVDQAPAAPSPSPPPAVTAPTVDIYLAPEPPRMPAPPVAAAPAEEPGGPGPLSADRRKLILAMADKGYSVTEIAKATGTGKGEIMLLLQLNKK